jgi:hypothetical protein
LAAGLRRGGEKTIPGLRAMIEEDTMNPNFTYAIVAERMQTLQAEAEASRTRHAARNQRGTARARLARRPRWWLAFAPAGSGR